MSLKQLEKYASSNNIADLLDEDKLAEVSHLVMDGFDRDKSSAEDWLTKADKIMSLVNLPLEEKMFPWPGAANIKYPLLTMAIYQFSSRTLPEFARDGNIVKPRIIGRDPTGLKFKKGGRVCDYLNYKLLDEDSSWWDEHDKLLHVVSAIGTAFTKTCYNPLTGKVESKLINYRDIIVNNSAPSLDEAARISHRVMMSKNAVIQGIRSGFYSDVELSSMMADDETKGPEIEFIEQHCLLDLDGDDYEEPYVVLLHPDSRQILRITASYGPEDVFLNEKDQVASIVRRKYFTDYHFLPNPDGSFYSNGFGTLLLSLNSAVNSILNQLVDAGTLSNTQSGYIDGKVRIKRGEHQLKPGELTPVEGTGNRTLDESIYMLNFKEPSSTLYQLLGLIINATRELTSTTEVMTGNVETQNTSPNTLAQTIQQGMTVYLAIQRRVFSGLKKELKLIFEHYGVYVDPRDYVTVLDLSEQELVEVFPNGFNQVADFDPTVADVVPVSDMNSSTGVQRALKAQSLFNMYAAAPGLFNGQEIAKEMLIAQDLADVERFIAPPPQGPNLQEIEIQSEIADKAAKTRIEEMKLQIDMMKLQLEELKVKTQAGKTIAETKAIDSNVQLSAIQHQVETMSRAIEMEQRDKELQIAAQSNKSAQ